MKKRSKSYHFTKHKNILNFNSHLQSKTWVQMAQIIPFRLQQPNGGYPTYISIISGDNYYFLDQKLKQTFIFTQMLKQVLCLNNKNQKLKLD